MLRRLVVLVSALALSGCFVFEELDAGREILEKTGPQEQNPAEGAPEETAKKPAGSDWWSKAQSIGPGAADAEDVDPRDPTAVISCRIAGSTRYMRRGDCITQGGAPKG